MLCPNVNFIAGIKAGISSKKLHTEMYFLEKSRDHIHDAVNKSYSQDVSSV